MFFVHFSICTSSSFFGIKQKQQNQSLLSLAVTKLKIMRNSKNTAMANCCDHLNLKYLNFCMVRSDAILGFRTSPRSFMLNIAQVSNLASLIVRLIINTISLTLVVIIG